VYNLDSVKQSILGQIYIYSLKVIIKAITMLKRNLTSFFFANGKKWRLEQIIRIFFFSTLGISETFLDTNYIPMTQCFHLKG